jgi:CHAT domain-containing protein
VTPSGWLWAQPRASHQHPRSTEQLLVLLVCGRNLPGGEQEIRRLRRLYREPTVLTGRQATVPAVLAAMEHADLVHLAAHGTFRADNPMFSSLHLHDGPLTVYDLESLTSPPSTVILPACDAARPAVQHGDELLGTASALLQVGVGTVIAPLTAVSDAAVVPLMFELHRQILAGWRPDHALVRARQSVGRDHAGSEPMAAASFVSVGTSAASHGWVPAGQRWGGTGEALSGLARRRR